MAKRRTGRNILSYLGVESSTPPNYIEVNRAPGVNDYIEFNIGDFWLDTTTNVPPEATDVYMLVSKSNRSATWIAFASGNDIRTLTGDTGGAISGDSVNNIDVLGGNNITTVGTPGSNLLTIDLDGNVADSFPTDSGTATPSSGVLNILGTHNINTSGAGSTVTVTGDNVIFLGDLVDVSLLDALTLTTGNMVLAGSTASDTTNPLIHFGSSGNRISFFLNDVYLGQAAGNLTSGHTGIFNVGIGPSSCSKLTNGTQNVAVGNGTLKDANTAQDNVMLGYVAGAEITTGSSNIGIGSGVFDSAGALGLKTGSRNIALGNGAGSTYNTSESDNILLNSNGTITESNVLRIGRGTGTGSFQINECFISGIRGITTGVADAVAVLVDSAEQLGTVSSSLRYKQNIKDMDTQSRVIYELRPVTFNYRKHPDIPAWGLIAEEVDEVFPQLVVYDKEDHPEAVKYHDLVPLLLNEVQKLNKRLSQLEKGCQCKGNL